MKITQQYAEKIRQPLNNRMRDYTGVQKGMLLLLWPTTERMSHSGIKWAAKCQCGSYTLILPCAAGTYSCGCRRSAVSAESGRLKRSLTESEAAAIKKGIMSGKDCAAVFGVSQSVISKIRSGNAYANVQ